MFFIAIVFRFECAWWFFKCNFVYLSNCYYYDIIRS